MSADELTDEQATELGKACREAAEGNLIVGSFAAELVGESYPFSKAQRNVVFGIFKNYAELGRRFARWCDEQEEGGRDGSGKS